LHVSFVFIGPQVATNDAQSSTLLWFPIQAADFLVVITEKETSKCPMERARFAAFWRVEAELLFYENDDGTTWQDTLLAPIM